MSDKKLPDPLPNAKRVANLAAELIGMKFPPLGWAMKGFIAHRLERDMEILTKRVALLGVSSLEELTEGQREYLLPTAYRFAESIRQGEYEHNLRVLAAVIINGWPMEAGDNGDPAKTQRAANQLSGIRENTLIALGRSKLAFRKYGRHLEDVNTTAINVESLIRVYSDLEHNLNTLDAEELLMEICSRGLMIRDDGRIGPPLFRKTTAYDELIGSVEEVIGNQFP